MMQPISEKRWLWALVLVIGLGIFTWLMFEILGSNSKWREVEDQSFLLLEDALQNTDPFVRSAAAKALGDSRDPNVLPLLKIALEDPYPTVRLFALEGAAFLPKKEALPILRIGLDDPDSSVRLTAVRIIVQKTGKGKISPGLRPLLLNSLEDKDVSVRLAILGALGISEDLRTLKVLEESLMSHEEEIRLSAAYALGLTHDPAAIPLLEKALLDPSDSVRAYSVRSLGELGLEEGLSSITKALSDNNSQVRSLATGALAALEPAQVIPILRTASSDRDAFVRLSVGIALAELGEKSSQEMIEEGLHHADYSIRSAAARSTGRLLRDHPGAIEKREAIVLLIPLVKDEVPRVRSATIRAMGMIGTTQEIPLLTQSFQDPSLTVRPYAAGAVLGILHRTEPD